MHTNRTQRNIQSLYSYHDDPALIVFPLSSLSLLLLLFSLLFLLHTLPHTPPPPLPHTLPQLHRQATVGVVTQPEGEGGGGAQGHQAKSKTGMVHTHNGALGRVKDGEGGEKDGGRQGKK